jgi:rhodanese-related sulfurtransferase
MKWLGIGLVSMFAITTHPVWADHPMMTWGLQTIDAERLKTLLDKGQKLVLVDVRAPEEFQKGHIPGARSLSLDEPGDRFRELPKGEVIVLYCSCPLSEIGPAYQFLRYSGYHAVLILNGGLPAWAARGYPLSR